MKTPNTSRSDDFPNKSSMNEFSALQRWHGFSNQTRAGYVVRCAVVGNNDSARLVLLVGTPVESFRNSSLDLSHSFSNELRLRYIPLSLVLYSSSLLHTYRCFGQCRFVISLLSLQFSSLLAYGGRL